MVEVVEGKHFHTEVYSLFNNYLVARALPIKKTNELFIENKVFGSNI